MRRPHPIVIVILVMLCLATGVMFGREFISQCARFQRTEASMERMGSSLRSIDSPEQAELALDVWGIWVATNHYGYPTWTSYVRRLSQTRAVAVSNVVVGLEGYSGLRYGTNLEAWRHWFAIRPAEEGANQTVQRTGASRSTLETNRESSAAGSRR